LILFISKDVDTSVDNSLIEPSNGTSNENQMLMVASRSNDNDPGYAPLSPETPYWGPPVASGGSDSSNDPGYAPISPETPSWGPPAGSGGSGSSGSGSSSNSNCGYNCPPFWNPIIVYPGQNNTSSTGLANVRFLYAATGIAPVNIRLGNRNVISRMQFGNSTPYYLENAGNRSIQITNANTGIVLYRGTFAINDGTAYTMAIVNSGSGISVLQLTDVACTNRSSACVRAVNLSPNSGAVDFFLTGAGRVFRNVGTYSSTSYRNILRGSYRAVVSEALPCASNTAVTMASTYVECNNTRIAIMDSTYVTFMNGVSYTLYLIGLANQSPVAQLISLESDLVY